MGYSGLIYAAIVAAWAAVLVPRWVRRNEEVERAREADTVRGVRVLQRRSGRSHAPHSLITALADDEAAAHSRPGVSARPTLRRSAAPASSGRAVSASRGTTATRAMSGRVRSPAVDRAAAYEVSLVFAEAARRRRRVFSALLCLSAATLGAMLAGLVPGWVPIMALLLVAGFLFVARRAVVTQAQRRRQLTRRAVSPSDEESAYDQVEPEGGGRRLVIPDELMPAAPDPDAWQPVPVPLPMYVTMPEAPRVARTIDLSLPGSWTSGRLDPAGSIILPRRDLTEPLQASPADDANAADDMPEHRRAVGD